jgi:TPP-dependent pyruvate/acetoin dehydrogenase alpha subunit
MQMTIAPADSSKASSQTVFERKMDEKLQQLKQSGKIKFLKQVTINLVSFLQV